MAATVASLWRHPIKGVGAEALQEVALSEGRCLPFDRRWAIAQEGAVFDPDTPAWMHCRNFVRGAKAQKLMAVTARMTESGITLSHPDRRDITVDPETDEAALLSWLAPLYPTNRPAPERLVSAGRAMTDSDFESVAILNRASLRALGQRAGALLDERRFRGNIWLEGLAPWEEFDLVGKQLTVGKATLEVVEPITRCRATHGNPETGRADVDVLATLEAGWGHQDFGVYAKVTHAGSVSIGDAARF